MALVLLAFVGNATLRPAIASAAAPAEANDPEEPGAPAPSAPPTVTPYPGGAAPAPPYTTSPYGQRPPPGYAYPPPYAPYGPGYPPLQLVQVHKVRRGLVTGGAITFGVSWGIAASVALLLGSSSNCNDTGCSNSADYLWIPIAGPLVVASRDSSSDSPGIFILWSAAQAAGVAMFIIGMMGHDVMEYRVAQGGPTLHLTPMLARETGGMALTASW